jgi:hypothetical protein
MPSGFTIASILLVIILLSSIYTVSFSTLRFNATFASPHSGQGGGGHDGGSQPAPAPPQPDFGQGGGGHDGGSGQGGEGQGSDSGQGGEGQGSDSGQGGGGGESGSVDIDNSRTSLTDIFGLGTAQSTTDTIFDGPPTQSQQRPLAGQQQQQQQQQPLVVCRPP